MDFSQELKILARSYFPDCFIEDYKYSPYNFGFYIITFDHSIKVCLGTNCIHVYSHCQLKLELGHRHCFMLNELNWVLKTINRSHGNQSRTYNFNDVIIAYYIAYRHALLILDEDPENESAIKIIKKSKKFAKGILDINLTWKKLKEQI